MKRSLPITKYDERIRVVKRCARIVEEAHVEDGEASEGLDSLIQKWENKKLEALQTEATMEERIVAEFHDMLKEKTDVKNFTLERHGKREPYLLLGVDSKGESCTFGPDAIHIPPDIEYPTPYSAFSAYKAILKYLNDKEVGYEDERGREAFCILLCWAVKIRKLSVKSTNEELFLALLF